jgi:hypothetical protein
MVGPKIREAPTSPSAAGRGVVTKTTVRVFSLDGYEVCPEKGLAGMHELREQVPG